MGAAKPWPVSGSSGCAAGNGCCFARMCILLLFDSFMVVRLFRSISEDGPLMNFLRLHETLRCDSEICIDEAVCHVIMWKAEDAVR